MGLACSRGGQAPAVLSVYLDALVSGDLAEAFEMTQFADRQASLQGAALSEEHFTAFYEASPLRSYEITKVIRLDRRDPLGPAEQTTPEWIVSVTLTYGDGARAEEFTVQGSVLADIFVDPVPVAVRPPTKTTELLVDGIEADVSETQLNAVQGAFRVLVLNGRHELTIGDAVVTISTVPLTVISGPARVDRSGDAGELLVLTA